MEGRTPWAAYILPMPPCAFFMCACNSASEANFAPQLEHVNVSFLLNNPRIVTSLRGLGTGLDAARLTNADPTVAPVIRAASGHRDLHHHAAGEDGLAALGMVPAVHVVGARGGEGEGERGARGEVAAVFQRVVGRGAPRLLHGHRVVVLARVLPLDGLVGFRVGLVGGEEVVARVDRASRIVAAVGRRVARRAARQQQDRGGGQPRRRPYPVRPPEGKR